MTLRRAQGHGEPNRTMTKEKKHITIKPVWNGTVLDHIKAGKAIEILRILNFPGDANMGIAMNVPSKKYGKKDIVFVEGLELSERDISKIAIISPETTLNLVKNGRVNKKINLAVPEKIEGALQCPNPLCVSNHENINSSFMKIAEREFQCYYCELSFAAEELINPPTFYNLPAVRRGVFK